MKETNKEKLGNGEAAERANSMTTNRARAHSYPKRE